MREIDIKVDFKLDFKAYSFLNLACQLKEVEIKGWVGKLLVWFANLSFSPIEASTAEIEKTLQSLLPVVDYIPPNKAKPLFEVFEKHRKATEKPLRQVNLLPPSLIQQLSPKALQCIQNLQKIARHEDELLAKLELVNLLNLPPSHLVRLPKEKRAQIDALVNLRMASYQLDLDEEDKAWLDADLNPALHDPE